ncbi:MULTISPECIES: tyrosine--tRNA ligase [Halobacteriovorax]|uniref:Tyrosine--tRNA ligase n=1 Tax=Halobacteriovorax vibrionivorans TaxID=2152716 RepID=A0ABY0IDB8_9BACT|nr:MULTISPECIES: tyrosine--tRNA ligase [Halobacteriovorax]RZF20951.1 tyrosine--tRNA ligase [Halobacteriovorax vibrionivorans]TGD46051.1 tyrosine--tRNA ligase [Halobacteriovorax sp. Y22]
MNFFEELEARGIVNQFSHDELKEILNEKKISFYCGYDPTAKSLQLGNLFAVVTMMRLQKQGHKPYVLVGGATGMIGDPSGKSDERNLQTQDDLDKNLAGQKAQLEKLLDFSGENAATMVNNIDWIGKFSLIEFLRDVGKRFRIGEMLSKDSVKSRLNSDAGISFTEFTYQMIQGYDFAHLNKEYDVSLQIGGADQWGNMVAGMDLTRKMHSKPAFCMTIPLLTDSNGKKFGKSEGGAIYLDPSMTSPYKMYQFLLNSDDSSVIKYLKTLTFLTLEEIAEYEKLVETEPHLRAAQKRLAEEIVTLVHGKEGLEAAIRATDFFFGKVIENTTDEELAGIFDDVPSIELDKAQLGELSYLDMLALTPLFKSKGEARKMVGQNGVAINNVKNKDIDHVISKDDLASESCLILKKGKKNYCVVKFI